MHSEITGYPASEIRPDCESRRKYIIWTSSHEMDNTYIVYIV